MYIVDLVWYGWTCIISCNWCLTWVKHAVSKNVSMYMIQTWKDCWIFLQKRESLRASLLRWQGIMAWANRANHYLDSSLKTCILRLYPIEKNMITIPETNIAPEKMMVGRLFSFWDGPFSRAMLVSGRVYPIVLKSGINGKPVFIKIMVWEHNNVFPQFQFSQHTFWIVTYGRKAEVIVDHRIEQISGNVSYGN